MPAGIPQTQRWGRFAIELSVHNSVFILKFRKGENLAMAETSKLSVGQALEKLRGTDTPKTKMTRLERLRAAKTAH